MVSKLAKSSVAMASLTVAFALFLTLSLWQFAQAQYRNRPRGLGLLTLPTGMTDERSGPFFPNLYIAGDKSGTRPQTVPDLHLPGQTAVFTGKSAFNPFTNAVGGIYHEDLVDSWGAGFGVNGVNNYNLKVRQNFDEFADAPLGHNDGAHQPFLTGLAVGSEYDLSKIREVAGSLDLPLPGINELFDLDGRFMVKGFGNGILNANMDFPLSLSDPHERFPTSMRYLNFMADRLVHYGHVVPNVNLFLLPKDKIMERLVRNRANPTMIG